MENAELRENVKEILMTEKIMHIATVVDGTPSISPTFFGYDGSESFEIYFFTLTSTKKAQHIVFNKNVEVHISRKINGREVRGLQITGRVDQIKDDEFIEEKIKPLITEASDSIFTDYYDLPLAGWYRLVPTRLKYIDLLQNPQYQFLEFRENQPSFYQNLGEAFVSRIKLWLTATRGPFFTASIIPMFVGAALAWSFTGYLHLPFLILTVIGGAVLQAGANFMNDYFDHKSRTDEDNEFGFIPFFGGSRTIQAGLMSSTKVGVSAVLFFMIGGLIGLYLELSIGGGGIALLVLFGFFLGIFYTADPLRLGYRSLGEIVVGLGLGPAYTLVSYYVQAGSVGDFSLNFNFWIIGILWSIPFGLMGSNMLLINEFQDYESDLRGGKKTLVVRFGKKRALFLYKQSIIWTYVFILIGALLVFTNAFFTVIALLTVPYGLKAIRHAEKNYNNIFELIPANIMTIKNQFFTGLLVIIGLLITPIIFSFF